MSKMSDAQLKSLLGKLPKWMQESEQQARKAGGEVKIPKKPVSTKGKKTVPAKLNWGKGVTKDKLAYINADEAAMLKARRGDAPVRKVRGIPAYAEETVGPGGGGGKGGSGGGSSSGTGGGTSSGSSSSSGASSAASSSSSGSKTTDDKKAPAASSTTKSPAAPAASAPKSAPPSSSFGPREGTIGTAAKDPTKSDLSQASKVAADAAVKAVASGSIVSPTTGVAQKSITDRVPAGPTADQAAAARAAVDTAKMMSGPGSYSDLSNPMAGANSPLAGSTNSYDRNAMDTANKAASDAEAAKASQYSSLGPSVPAGTANYTDAQRAAMYGGSSPDVSKAMNVAQAATTAAPVSGLNESVMAKTAAPTAPISTSPTAHTVADKYGVAKAPTSYAPGDYATYRAEQEAAMNRQFGKEIGDNVYNGVGAPASSVASSTSSPVDDGSIATPAGTITAAQLSQMAPEDQKRLKDWAAANPPGRTRGIGAAAPSMMNASVASGLSPAVSPAAREPADVPSAAPAAVASVTTPAVPAAVTTPSVVPSKQPSPTWAEKIEKPFSRVESVVSHPAEVVDNFLTSIFGAAGPNSAYSKMMANDDGGSNNELPRPGNGGGQYAAAGSFGSGSGKKNIPKVSLPALPPYVNYQNLPGTASTGVVLPAASQPILDYINNGYADGGQVGGGQVRPVTSYGIHGAPGGGVAPSAAPAAQSPQVSQPAQPANSNPWNLQSTSDTSETTSSGNVLPGGKYQVTSDGRIVPNYANQSGQQIFSNWLGQQVAGMQGQKGTIPNFGELMARLDSRGRMPGQKKATTGGEDPGTGTDGSDVGKAGLTGPGTPGAWSGTKTGWARGGHVNDSIAAALRLARMLGA